MKSMLRSLVLPYLESMLALKDGGSFIEESA